MYDHGVDTLTHRPTRLERKRHDPPASLGELVGLSLVGSSVIVGIGGVLLLTRLGVSMIKSPPEKLNESLPPKGKLQNRVERFP